MIFKKVRTCNTCGRLINFEKKPGYKPKGYIGTRKKRSLKEDKVKSTERFVRRDINEEFDPGSD